MSIRGSIVTLFEPADLNIGRLGCVLLEIGFWQSLESFHFDDAYNARDRLQTPRVQRSTYVRERLIGLTHELSGQVGSTYARAVRECLRIEMNCPSEKVEEILCWKVAAALDQCMA